MEVDPSEIEKSSKEFFIDFRGENSEMGKMIIKPKNFAEHDPEIKERLENKNDNLNRPSVVNLFLDTTSKYRFYRKFKKTIKFLTDLKHDPESAHKVVENERFHSVAGFTDPNQLGHTHGVSSRQCAEAKDLKRIDTYAKELGYITGYH